jgi:hypothetical protein
MESLDLDISAYSLDDLYSLFHLEPGTELTEYQMKHAKRMALQTHPDKSKLNAKYFLFFSQAYKILHSLYLRNSLNLTKNKKNGENLKYNSTATDEKDEDNEHLSRFFYKNPQLRTDSTKFNDWFNREFVQCSETMYDADRGYGEWLQDVPTQSINKDNFQSYKNQIIASSSVPTIQQQQSSSMFGNSALIGDASAQTFSFTNGTGTDIKDAWSETVYAVSEDMTEGHMHDSVQSYRHTRDRQDTTPLEKHEAERILAEQEKRNNLDGMSRMYYYTKHEKNTQMKKQLFWSKLKQLT